MKNNRLSRSSTECHPAWYLSLLVVPAVTALIFIGAGAWRDQQSSLAQVKPAVSATAPVVVSDARDGKTTAR